MNAPTYSIYYNKNVWGRGWKSNVLHPFWKDDGDFDISEAKKKVYTITKNRLTLNFVLDFF